MPHTAEEGIGRRYVLEAVAEEIRQDGNGNPLVLPIDLDLFDQSRPYRSFVELAAKKYTEDGLQSKVLVQALEELSKVASKTIAEAAFLETLFKIARSSLLPLLEGLMSSTDLARSRLPGGERLLRLLARWPNLDR